jgi:hypothetical protein
MPGKRMNKRANVIAAVLLVIMTAVSAAVYTTYQLNPPEKKEEKKAFTESELAVRRSLVLGVADFLEGDMVKNSSSIGGNKLWYCNYPYPASLMQLNNSLNSFINFSFTGYLNRLGPQLEPLGAHIASIPKVSVVGMNSLGELNNDSIKIEINDFIIETNESGAIRGADISKKQALYFRLGKIYKGLFEWINQSDAGNLTQNIYSNLFDIAKKQCQAYACTCGNDGKALISDDDLNDLKINKDEIKNALSISINNLNKLFNGSGIVCGFQINNRNIEIINNVKRNQSFTDYCSDRDVHYVDNWPDAGEATFNAFDSTRIFNTEADCNKDNGFGDSIRSQKIPVEMSNGTVFDFDFKDKRNIEAEKSVSFSGVKMMEKVAVSSAANFVFDVECKDTKVSIDSGSGFETFAIRISMGLSLVRNCDIPPILPEQAYTSGPCEFAGGSVGGKRCRQEPVKPEGIEGHCKVLVKNNCSIENGIKYCNCSYVDCRCSIDTPNCNRCDESTQWECKRQFPIGDKPPKPEDGNCDYTDACDTSGVKQRLLSGMNVTEACVANWTLSCGGLGPGDKPCDPNDYNLQDVCGREIYVKGIKTDCLEIQCVGSGATCFVNGTRRIDDDNAARELCGIASGRSYNLTTGKAVFCNRASCDKTKCLPYNEGRDIPYDEIKYTFCQPCQKAVCDSAGYVKCVAGANGEWDFWKQYYYRQYTRINETYNELINRTCSSQGIANLDGNYYCYNLMCVNGQLTCNKQADEGWGFYWKHWYYMYYRQNKTFDKLFREICSDFQDTNTTLDGRHFNCYKMQCTNGRLVCNVSDGVKSYLPEQTTSTYNYDTGYSTNANYWYYYYITDPNASKTCIDNGLSADCIVVQCSNGKINCSGQAGRSCIPSGYNASDISCNRCDAEGKCTLKQANNTLCGSWPYCTKCQEGKCLPVAVNTVCYDPGDSCPTGCDENGKCTVPLNLSKVCGNSYSGNECYKKVCTVPANPQYYYNNSCAMRGMFDPSTQKCCGTEASTNATICSKNEQCCSVFDGRYTLNFCGGCGAQ